MKRLFLFRHAKAVQANKDTPADAERPLTKSGRADAARIGRAMRAQGYNPDRILCSPSVRTKETLECANAELRSAAPVDYVEGIYDAPADRLLAIAQRLADARRPMMVGHNPGFEEFSALLVRESGAAAFAGGDGKARFPTAGLAVLDFDIAEWKELGPHRGVLVGFLKPRDLPGG
ncbi:MAG TPA: histidine phosphatase family protein [Rhizomicrobium sp.]|nr:histidine phosphatase family protein [Rhizomicrobium sp.]